MRVSKDDEFYTAKTYAFGVNIWQLCVFEQSLDSELIPFRDGGTHTDFAPLEAVSISSFLSAPLAYGIPLRVCRKPWARTRCMS